jgi:hypothetical protein
LIFEAMKQFENQHGGLTVSLDANDSLDAIPASLRSLVAPHIEQAFHDPRIVFSRVAKRSSLKNMAQYLDLMIAFNQWRLVVAESYCHTRVTRVGFYWYHPDCFPVTVAIRPKPSKHPSFKELFDLIDAVYWDQVAHAGGILPVADFHSLDGYGLEQGEFSPDSQATIFGTDSNGDVFVFDARGRAAIISHETGDAMHFDSIHDCCDWIFERLLAGSPPAFQWNRSGGELDGTDETLGPRIFRPDE